MKHDVGDGVEGPRRQALGRGDEVTRGIVDQAGQSAAGPQGIDHLLHRLRDADVQPEGVDAPLREALAPGGSGFVTYGLAPATDGDVGAEFEKPLRHGPAQAGAAAGDQDALACHQLCLKHVLTLCNGLAANGPTTVTW